MNDARADLFLVIGFGAAGVFLVILGVVLWVSGFGVDRGGVALLFGGGLLFAAYAIAEVGFVERWPDIYSGPY